MKNKIRSVRIEKAANGHSVTTEYEPSAGNWQPSPPPHVFGDDEKPAMMDHIVSQLDNDGTAEPDQDDTTTPDNIIAAHNRKARLKADPEKAAAYLKELRSRR